MVQIWSRHTPNVCPNELFVLYCAEGSLGFYWIIAQETPQQFATRCPRNEQDLVFRTCRMSSGMAPVSACCSDTASVGCIPYVASRFKSPTAWALGLVYDLLGGKSDPLATLWIHVSMPVAHSCPEEDGVDCEGVPMEGVTGKGRVGNAMPRR